MAQQIQVRRDVAATWTSVNPTLASGEIGFETDTGEIKIGDGSTAWNDLSYFSGGGGGGVTDHGALTGLLDDDHTQYHTDARGDVRYYTKTQLDAGQLDTRYYTESQTDTLLAGKQNILGFTPEDVANKSTTFNTVNDTLYPSVKAVNDKINSVVSSGVSYIMSGVNSDISGYESMPQSGSYTPGALATVTQTVTTTPTLMEEFSTNSGFPGITYLPAGVFTCHYETQKASGSNNYRTYFELYKRSAGGTETLLLTSENSSDSALNTNIQQTVSGLLNSAETLLVTDRLVVKIYCVMLSSSASIDLKYDNNTGARFSLPSSPLGYIPENVENKSTSTSLGTSDVLYPSQNAVKSYVDTGLAGKQNLLGFTPENVANKDNGTLSTSTTTYPTSNAVKTAVDAKANLSGGNSFTGTQAFGDGVLNRFSADVVTVVSFPYTIQASDNGKLLRFNTGSAAQVDLPNSLPVGFNIAWSQSGTGQITFAPGAGATMNNRQTHTKSAGQYAMGALIVMTNTGSNAMYNLSGDTAT